MKDNIIKIIALTVILFVVGLVFGLIYEGSENKNMETKQEEQMVVDSSTYETRTMNIDDPYVDFDIKYPHFFFASAMFNEQIKKVFSPYFNRFKCKTTGVISNFNHNESSGIVRASDFFINKVDGAVWFLAGYIKGGNNIPIVILHYEMVNISVYAQKLIDEKQEIFSSLVFSNN